MKRDDRQIKMNDKQVKLTYPLLISVAVFSLLFLMAVDSKAADPAAGYPSRPIECVTHNAPGGSMDVMGRVIGEILLKEKLLSQPMIMLNKVGSGGASAFGYAYERKVNPHVMVAVSGTFMTTPLTLKLPYTSMSFTPIANMLADGSILVVRADSPFKTIQDLMAEAKKRPKELSQGGSSFTGNESMMAQAIQKLKGVQWNFISFSGGGTEALLNLLGGNVTFCFVNPAQAIEHIRAGKLRVLLTGFSNRFKEFKDAPTMKEAGLGEPILAYRGFVGPPNMPDYAAQKIATAFKKVMEHDKFKKFYEDGMMQPCWISLNEYGKFIQAESSRWKVLLGEFGLLAK
jgi:putative tricarboxylic transport membrane protein